MPQQLVVIVGLLLGAGILAAIGLIAIGIVLYYVLGKLVRGQQFMRTGATVALGTMFAGTVFNFVRFRGGVPTWETAILMLVTVLIVFAGPSLRKRYRDRQDPK